MSRVSRRSISRDSSLKTMFPSVPKNTLIDISFKIEDLKLEKKELKKLKNENMLNAKKSELQFKKFENEADKIQEKIEKINIKIVELKETYLNKLHQQQKLIKQNNEAKEASELLKEFGINSDEIQNIGGTKRLKKRKSKKKSKRYKLKSKSRKN